MRGVLIGGKTTELGPRTGSVRQRYLVPGTAPDRQLLWGAVGAEGLGGDLQAGGRELGFWGRGLGWGPFGGGGVRIGESEPTLMPLECLCGPLPSQPLSPCSLTPMVLHAHSMPMQRSIHTTPRGEGEKKERKRRFVVATHRIKSQHQQWSHSRAGGQRYT